MQNVQNGRVRKTESTKLSKIVSLKNGIGTVRYANDTVFGKILKAYCIDLVQEMEHGIYIEKLYFVPWT